MGKNFKSEQLLLMTLVKNQGATADSILQNQWHIERHLEGSQKIFALKVSLIGKHDMNFEIKSSSLIWGVWLQRPLPHLLIHAIAYAL